MSCVFYQTLGSLCVLLLEGAEIGRWRKRDLNARDSPVDEQQSQSGSASPSLACFPSSYNLLCFCAPEWAFPTWVMIPFGIVPMASGNLLPSSGGSVCVSAEGQ